MEFGLNYFPTHDGTDPATVARLAEQRGLAALYFCEHTHMPVDHTPFPRGELPHRYVHAHELFVALAAAATVTTRLRLGSGVCQITQRDPIITAKQVASVDALSGGRFDFGVGAGWNLPELRNHGTDPASRMQVMRERVEAMQAIWTRDEASYHGRYVDFDPIWSWPKPVQHPHPPVLVGGYGPTIVDRVLDYGDGWIAVYGGPGLDRTTELRERAKAAGKPEPILAINDIPADPREIETHARLGFTRLLHDPGALPLGSLERALDRWESAIVEFLGA